MEKVMVKEKVEKERVFKEILNEKTVKRKVRVKKGRSWWNRSSPRNCRCRTWGKRPSAAGGCLLIGGRLVTDDLLLSCPPFIPRIGELSANRPRGFQFPESTLRPSSNSQLSFRARSKPIKRRHWMST